jgi:microsomal epoxide hydrolase
MLPSGPRNGGRPSPEGETVNVPMGYAEFPKEILHPPRSLAEKVYTDIRRWSVMPKGGHFAALEQPEALAREVHELLAKFSQVVERKQNRIILFGKGA